VVQSVAEACAKFKKPLLRNKSNLEKMDLKPETKLKNVLALMTSLKPSLPVKQA